MLLSLSRFLMRRYPSSLSCLCASFERRRQGEVGCCWRRALSGQSERTSREIKHTKHVIFTGMIAPSETALYYKAADFFISASTSETQGLTYLESLASGTPVIAHGNPYLENLINDKMFGTLYYGERELAGAILEALIATPDMSEQKLADKLYEISAENFGNEFMSFTLMPLSQITLNMSYMMDNLSLNAF